MTGSFWRRLASSHELSLLAAILLVAVLTNMLDAQHNYFSNPRDSAIDILRQWSLLALFAVGAAVVIIAGGIDLSAGSVIAFSGTLCATLLLLLDPETSLKGDPNAPLSYLVIGLAIGGTLVGGFLIGSLHTWLITRVGLPPFVATLATLVGLRSLGRAMCEQVMLSVTGAKSTQIQVFDARFRFVATSVYIPALMCIVIGIVVWLLLSRTVVGRRLYALGGNEQAAKLSGIRTDLLKWMAYSLSAVLSSLAGIVYIAEQSVADPQTLGRGYELNAIAAAVVGGCSLQGGVGTIPGTLLGALFLRLVIDGVGKVIKTGADVYEGLIVGVVVVLAVTFTQMSQSGNRREGLFAGALGALTVLNLALLAALLGSLVGPRFLPEGAALDGRWLALLCGVAACALLVAIRQLPTTLTRLAGLAIVFVAMLGAGFWLEHSIPGWRRSAAEGVIRTLGGQLLANDDGTLVVDFGEVKLADDQFRDLAAALKPLTKITEFRLQKTQITDAVVEQFKQFPDLQKINVSGSGLTNGGVLRLRRLPQGPEVSD